MTREGLPRCTGPAAPAQLPARASGGGSEPAAQDDPSLIVNPYLPIAPEACRRREGVALSRHAEQCMQACLNPAPAAVSACFTVPCRFAARAGLSPALAAVSSVTRSTPRAPNQ